jgi:hypothetical protein
VKKRKTYFKKKGKTDETERGTTIPLAILIMQHSLRRDTNGVFLTVERVYLCQLRVACVIIRRMNVKTRFRIADLNLVCTTVDSFVFFGDGGGVGGNLVPSASHSIPSSRSN